MFGCVYSCMQKVKKLLDFFLNPCFNFWTDGLMAVMVPVSHFKNCNQKNKNNYLDFLNCLCSISPPKKYLINALNYVPHSRPKSGKQFTAKVKSFIFMLDKSKKIWCRVITKHTEMVGFKLLYYSSAKL